MTRPTFVLAPLILLCSACSGVGSQPIGEVGYVGTDIPRPAAARTATPPAAALLPTAGAIAAQATSQAAQAAQVETAAALSGVGTAQALIAAGQAGQLTQAAAVYGLTATPAAARMVVELTAISADATGTAEAGRAQATRAAAAQSLETARELRVAEGREFWTRVGSILSALGLAALPFAVSFAIGTRLPAIIDALLPALRDWWERTLGADAAIRESRAATVTGGVITATARDEARLQAHRAAALMIVRWGNSFRDFGERTLTERRRIVLRPDTDLPWVEGYRAYLGREGWLRRGDDAPFAANARGAVWWAPGWDLERLEREWDTLPLPPPPETDPPRVPVWTRSAIPQSPQNSADPAVPQAA